MMFIAKSGPAVMTDAINVAKENRSFSTVVPRLFWRSAYRRLGVSTW